jgi:hypothetical protein
MPGRDRVSLGHIIGVAAVVASLPGTRSVEADKVRRIIEDITSSGGLADYPDIVGAARNIAATIITAARLEAD